MSSAPTDLDYIAAIIVLIILVISALTLFGMGILMALGAVFSNRPLVTSWPAEQQQMFASYERRGAMSNSQAWAVSLLGAVILMVTATGIYFGVAPDNKDIAKDMNMSNLTKRRSPAAVAPRPDPAAPAEAPAKPDPAAPAPAAPQR